MKKQQAPREWIEQIREHGCSTDRSATFAFVQEPGRQIIEQRPVSYLRYLPPFVLMMVIGSGILLYLFTRHAGSKPDVMVVVCLSGLSASGVIASLICVARAFSDSRTPARRIECDRDHMTLVTTGQRITRSEYTAVCWIILNSPSPLRANRRAWRMGVSAIQTVNGEIIPFACAALYTAALSKATKAFADAVGIEYVEAQYNLIKEPTAWTSDVLQSLHQ